MAYDIDQTLEEKLITKLLALLLEYFSDHDALESLHYFSQTNFVSYQQLLKYKHWLIRKGILVPIRRGRHENIGISEKGKELAKATKKFLLTIRGIDNG